MKMNKIALVSLLACAVAFAGCTKTEPAATPVNTTSEVSSEANTQIANPWTDTTADDLKKDLGEAAILPDGAENVVYRVLTEDKLYEVQFDKDGLSYNYRMQKASELTDISGLNYTWTFEEDADFNGNKAKNRRSITDELWVDNLMWYDASSGITHSLSTTSADLEGFDIVAIAEEMIK